MYKLKSEIDDLKTDWKNILKKNLNIDYINNNINLEVEKYSPEIKIFPPNNLVFSAFNYFNFDDLNVVIIGQDVYHNERNGIAEANGLCFSVSSGIPKPPSLNNLLKELNNDLTIPIPNHGNLESWAQQGILLLNCALTVRQKNPGSHYKYWKQYTDNLIQYISNHKSNVIYILLGNFAKNKKSLINCEQNFIIEATHPSPLSANRGGFFGSKIYSKTNNILEHLNKNIINWEL
jgi:uracil-DNA glycosylase